MRRARIATHANHSVMRGAAASDTTGRSGSAAPWSSEFSTTIPPKATVARPAVLAKRIHRLGRELQLLTQLEAELAHEVPRQRLDVRRPGPERGHRERHYVEPVKQILAEAPCLHHLLQRAMRRRDEA